MSTTVVGQLVFFVETDGGIIEEGGALVWEGII